MKERRGPRYNLVGQTFGRLTVIALDHITEDSHYHWKCQCVCGGSAVIATGTLRRANGTKSCGCLNKQIQSGRRGPIEFRFRKRIEKQADGCWHWRGHLDKDGYGTIGDRGNLQRAHRYSWELANGTVPDGLFVLHKCDVPFCVNPDHLFLGTQLDNMRDKIAKGRARNQWQKQAGCG